MPLLERDDCALVIIDVQTEFYGPKRLDVDRLQLQRVAERIAWLTAVAARLDVPVVVTEEDPDWNKHTFEVIGKELPPGAVTLPKNAFAVWDNPDIAAAIEATGRGSMVLVGLETDIRVAHSAIQLTGAGKRVAVVHDATFSPGAAHEAGLRRLDAQGIETLTVKEVFYDWIRTVEAANAFHDAHRDLARPVGLVL
ncbi:isochorismatase family protein [Nonomuraea sp. NPDC050536]|uniref:isochorismatase family protein n=1 Tax=Nonomuraea sp. NPDC050536 TaxID=3364366 RepID=UPI0037C99654